MSNKLLDAALDYAARGWGVIPCHDAPGGKCACGRADCHSPGKHPKTQHGIDDASTDANQIRSWWERWPSANVAIVLDTLHTFAADVDPRNGGVETWERIAQGREWPGPIAATGGHEQGRHYIAEGGESLPGKLGPGVDVKRRGYIIAPPSVHASGREYRWLRPPNGHIPQAPEWCKPARGLVIEQTPANPEFARTISKWADVAAAAREGERNIQLNRAAFVLGGLIHAGLSESAAYDALLLAARECGLGEQEARRTIRSGLTGGRKKPVTLTQANDYAALPSEVTVPGEEWTDPWGDPFTLADAYAPRPPIKWLVEGVFAEATLNMVYGGPGSLKSFILADMLACIASGSKWLNYQCSQGAVMWADWDNGQRRTHDRFQMVGQAHGLPDTAPMFYFSMPSPQLAANDPVHIERMYQRVMRYNARVLVIDNLSLISGKADENSAEMIAVMSGLRRLVEDTGCAVIAIHHQNKPNGMQRGRADKVRGHSSILASLDVALEVQRDLEGDTPSPEVFLAAGKVRDCEIAPFGARFWFEQVGGQTVKAGFEPTEWRASGERKTDALEAEVLAWARERGDWFSKSACYESLHKRQPVVSPIIERLAKDGKLESLKIGKEQPKFRYVG